MNELIEEHVFGRKTTKALVEANIRYRNVDNAALAEIAANLKTLTFFSCTNQVLGQYFSLKSGLDFIPL